MPRLPLITLALAAACTPAAEPAPPTAADLAGTWAFEVRPLDRDTVLATGTLEGSGDPLIWTMTLTGRDGRPSEVRVDGDTIRTRTGPYESPLRPGVQVTTIGIYLLVDGTLQGTVTSHYGGVTDGDSVARYRSSMRRVE